MLNAIRSSIGIKVSIALALLTVLLTGAAAMLIISRETRALQEQTLVKASLAAQLGAQTYGRVLDEGIDNGYLTPQDAFDTNYVEIKGYDWGKTPKYHTRYDFYTDSRLIPVLDRFLASKDIVSVVGVDVNGYAPTHDTKYSQPLTGKADKDLEGNRTKRKFDEPVAKAAASNEKEAVLIQPYRRDTGELTWDVSSPIYVKGKHWGAFRVLVSAAQIDAQRATLIYVLSGMFAGLVVVLGAAILLMVNRSLSPLVKLTGIADNLSMGEGLEQVIVPGSTDEVGRMARSLERLRVSLKAAMDRLGE